jgi:LmbE family N-acetylglucosaminyl deacetylase
MILAPHPDDESLGCGGLIAAACAMGLPPVVVFLTDGAGSHQGSRSFPPDRLRAIRQQEALTALALLGVPAERIASLDYPDGALPAFGAAADLINAQLAQLAQVWDCELVLAPWIEDPHCDHQAAARLAEALSARQKLQLWSYSVWGWLLPAAAPVRAVPGPGGYRLCIAPQLALKRRAIGAHRSQHGDLIVDAQTAFVLPPELLEVAMRPYEIYFSA